VRPSRDRINDERSSPGTAQKSLYGVLTSSGYGEMAMKCPNCGAENAEGKKFCGDCGSVIVASPMLQVQYVPVQYVSVQPKKPYQLRVNIFCLVGAVLAVISLFLPWAMLQDKESGDTANLGAFDFNQTFIGYNLFPSNFGYSVTIFLIGAAIAFFCPLGGILQLIGSVGFVISAMTVTFETVNMTFWIGAMVAVVSAAIVLMSLVYPLGTGYEEGRRDALGRLLTVSPTR